MNKENKTVALKRPYLMPQLLVVTLSSSGMLAGSGDTPEVHTTSEKANASGTALTRESTNIWDEEW